MLRSVFSLMLALTALLGSVPGRAEGRVVVYEEEWVEEVPAGASRFVSRLQEQVEQEAVAAYGPFRVIDDHTAALVGTTDGSAPDQFTTMLAAWPQIDRIAFVEAPGTVDDIANFIVGRMLRARGITTSVSKGGSVRSGAVELFLAGAKRIIAPEAEFAVHSWLDYDGHGAESYPAGSPEHQRYLDYYTEMGMTRKEAARFYAMTLSVPFEDALWLDGAEMARWIKQDADEGRGHEAPAVSDTHDLDSGALVQ